jgi:hypothetical protein
MRSDLLRRSSRPCPEEPGAIDAAHAAVCGHCAELVKALRVQEAHATQLLGTEDAGWLEQLRIWNQDASSRRRAAALCGAAIASAWVVALAGVELGTGSTGVDLALGITFNLGLGLALVQWQRRCAARKLAGA